METEIQRIENNKTDFKICLDCGAFNWYENGICCRCFSENKDGKAHFRELKDEDLEKEYQFWREEGYSEEEIDNLIIEV